MQNHYEILGLRFGSTKEEIKSAYRKMAHKYHPDKPDGDEEMMKKINVAYRALTGKGIRQQPVMRNPQPVSRSYVWVRYSYGVNTSGSTFNGGTMGSTY